MSMYERLFTVTRHKPFCDMSKLSSLTLLLPLKLAGKWALFQISSGKVLLNFEPFLIQRNTYLLTPWSRVLLQKLTGSAASQEIPRIFGTRMFITVFTSARHLSLS